MRASAGWPSASRLPGERKVLFLLILAEIGGLEELLEQHDLGALPRGLAH
jgi:hypothetical protein